MLYFLFWVFGLASLILSTFGNGLGNSLFGALLAIGAIVALCADMAADKVIRELRGKQ